MANLNHWLYNRKLQHYPTNYLCKLKIHRITLYTHLKIVLLYVSKILLFINIAIALLKECFDFLDFSLVLNGP